MRSLSKKLLCFLAVVTLLRSAMGFSLLGPFAAWQVAALGYQGTNELGLADIGGPMFLQSFYRYNLTNLTYAFDESFINYFGTNGMKAVDDAFAILNALPAASKMDLNTFPLDSRLWNPVAGQVLLMDVKSWTLSLLLEQLGLADPERYAWTLYYRAGHPTMTNYYVISMNYDPDTLNPTGRVNGIYYTYHINEPNGVADAVEDPVTFNDLQPFSSVAGGRLGAGHFYTGLTRDDAAGLKFLLSTNTLAVESLLPTVSQVGTSLVMSTGWIPYQGTTNVTTNFYSYYFGNSNSLASNILAGLTNGSNFVVTGIRGGVDKIHFQKVEFDSLIGQTFTPFTNYWTDVVLVTNKLISQRVMRTISSPDILFVADHLGFTEAADGAGGFTTLPIMATRTDTTAWIDNDALNGRTVEGGPGVITSPAATNGSVTITLTTDLGGLYNSNPYFLNEQWSTLGVLWGSFDNTPTPPTIYPVYAPLTVDQLLELIIQTTNTTKRLSIPSQQ
jgi:hypothetical protein